MRSFRNAPLACVPIESGEQTWLGGNRDAATLAGLERDALETEQSQTLIACRIGEIELRHVGALALADVLYGKARGDRLTRVCEERGLPTTDGALSHS